MKTIDDRNCFNRVSAKSYNRAFLDIGNGLEAAWMLPLKQAWGAQRARGYT